MIVLGIATSGSGRTLLTQDEAITTAFPRGTKVERETLFLEKSQLKKIARLSGQDFDQELVIRYVGRQGGKVVGYAYFDAHRVRTLPETIMVVIDPRGEITTIEILSFSEPADYFPSRRWLDQFLSRGLDEELALNRAIRPISGATLTGRAVTNASRKLLAVHQVVSAK